MSPGITVRRLRSITRVCGPLSLSVSAAVPTATIRPPRIASDSAMLKRSSTVTILPLTRMVSAGCACAAVPSAASKPIASAPMMDQRIVLLLDEIQCSTVGGSLGTGDAGLLDHRPPLVHLGLKDGRELVRRRAADDDTEGLELLPGRRIGERRDCVGVHLADDLGRRLRRHQEGIPG